MTSTCGVDKKGSRPGYRFHPFEIAFVGRSGTGKTHLLCKLLQHFSGERRIGYLKHDAHRFRMDHEGKDTWKATQAGAATVRISSDTSHATISVLEAGIGLEQALFLEDEWLFVEGFKNTELPKILLCDQAGELVQRWRDGRLSHVVAVVFPDEKSRFSCGDLPTFQRDDILGIADFVCRHMEKICAKIALRGLILDGGKSSRMGRHKGSLVYGGQNQLERSFQLLENCCESVLLSRRPGQDDSLPEGLDLLEDCFLGMGPLGGILSALRSDIHASWLVVACDLPLLDAGTLQELLEKRNPFACATAFRNPEFPEPLCAIYEPRIFALGLRLLSAGYSCPRKLLIQASARLVNPSNPGALRNVNTPWEADEIRKVFPQA